MQYIKEGVKKTLESKLDLWTVAVAYIKPKTLPALVLVCTNISLQCNSVILPIWLWGLNVYLRLGLGT